LICLNHGISVFLRECGGGWVYFRQKKSPLVEAKRGKFQSPGY